ncbi:unnamed protein product [Vitrella brassicaformis CCMP3155]|uniref:Uncharacterized protein n=3 Tax=Vitrella brassicaformis TaxID=1169539 RepID=A0A0G4EJW4_VITBC|nr:unnamed protein product [Vitrella brassicaformis CCMP3155]|eukprot:CEL96805.1 unnamed protein product [Vitrella brassicaformis CCMP3155]
MEFNKVKEEARRIEQRLRALQSVQTKISAQLMRVEELNAKHLTSEASSRSALAVHMQLAPLSTVIDNTVTQLGFFEPGLSSAVEALAATARRPKRRLRRPAPDDDEELEAQAEPAVVQSYRLIYESGRRPIKNGPARFRLSREELSLVFGHMHPWDLTPLWPSIGSHILNQAAAQYTHLTIDSSDRQSRRMWQKMPLSVAHKWGQRATHLSSLKTRYPPRRPKWCRGTWVALVEGHAIGRAAIVDKRSHERAEKASHGVSMHHDGDESADKGTLEALSFEAVGLAANVRPPRFVSPSYPLPALSAPTILPALKTVTGLPSKCAAVRVGRQWRTPHLRALTITSDVEELKPAAGASWIDGCRSLEVLEYQDDGYGGIDQERCTGELSVEMLSAVPPDGQPLANLRHLSFINMMSATAQQIDRLRETLVARGVRRSLKELRVEGRLNLENDSESRELAEAIGTLGEDTCHPETYSKPLAVSLQSSSERGVHISADLLFWARTQSRWVKRYVEEYARCAGDVQYDGEDEIVPEGAEAAAVTRVSDETFRCANTFHFKSSSGMSSEKIKRAAEIASHLTRLKFVELVGHSDLNAQRNFLKHLNATSVRMGRPPVLKNVHSRVSAGDLANEQPEGLFWTDKAMPSIEWAQISVHDGLDEEDDFDTFYTNLCAMMSSTTQLKGWRRTEVIVLDKPLRLKSRTRFRSQHEILSLAMAPTSPITFDFSLTYLNSGFSIAKKP